MSTSAIQAALDTMQAHVEALNARDPQAIARTLHFPHYRLAGTEVKIWETPDSYMDDFHRRAGDDWGHTEWGHLRPVQVSDTKVHLDVEVKRFDKAGEPLVNFISLWAITQVDGIWAAKLRSSFAKDLS